MGSEQVEVYCGIDWAEKQHDIALIDDDGQLVAKRRITESVEGFAELAAMLAEAGDNAEDPIPVAIETPRGLLVAALRATGRPVYPINPMAVARYPERHSVSRKKSDHLDAMTLANILRTDAHMHRGCPRTPSWRARSPCSPAPTRTRPGGAQRRPTSCAPCCASTTPASWPPSPAATPPTWPAQMPARCWPSRQPRRPRPS
jgi:hypothetical protein